MAGYNVVYAALAKGPTLHRIWREHVLGPEYPAGFEHLSFLTFAELRRMAAELRLGAGTTLVDLGCGSAGPSLWIVSGSGGRLLGIDAALVAITNAYSRARDRHLARVSGFVTARFECPAVRSESAAAVMSVDALQYATNKRATFAEVRRVLGAGGRFVFTAFELNPSAVAYLPVLGVDPVADFRPTLEAAGFAIEAYEESDGWKERVATTYEAVRERLPLLTTELGYSAATALGFEVSLALQWSIYRRRIVAVAVRRN